MRKTLFALVTVATLAIPSLAEAQLGLAGRAGTLGLGGEAALSLAPAFVIRGGMGFTPIEFNVSSFWDLGDDVETKLKIPSSYNIGADLYMGSSFRIGGGMLFKPDDLEATASVGSSGTIEIDGVPYDASQVSEVRGVLVSKSQAPYVLIGFGKHTSSGVGLFLDLGMAFTGDPTVELTAEGDQSVIDSPEFQGHLAAEQQSLQDDLPTYAKYWPILNLGVRVGVGR